METIDLAHLTLLVSLYFFLKPSEGWKVRAAGLVPLVMPDMPHWHLTLHPFKAAIPTRK